MPIVKENNEKKKKEIKKGNGRRWKEMPGDTYFPGPLPAKYRGRVGLYYCIRNGNRCFPNAIVTRQI